MGNPSFVEPNLRVTLGSEHASAPFSDFTGGKRTIVPLGAGLSLAFEDRRYGASDR